MKRLFLYVATSAALLAVSSAALADTRAMVLGVRSIEGDDEFALSLTGAIRHAAAQIPDWRVSDREVSLAQMSLAHGCDEPDAGCMAQIAETLGTDRVIYGTVRRTSAGARYDYAVTLYMFNAQSGQIEGSLTDTIPRVRSEIDFLRERVEGYVARLAGTERGGTLRVTGNVPGAEVLVDGVVAGTADESGSFVTELPAGRRRVEVRALGYTSFRGSVTVVSGTEAELEVTLSEGSGGSAGLGTEEGGGAFNWAGWGLVGAGVAAAVATVVVWLQAESDNEGHDITSDQCESVRSGDTFAAYRCNVPRERYESACDAADEGLQFSASSAAFDRAQTVCGRATVLQVLSWVLPVAAVGLAGVGALILALDSGDDGEAADTTLTFTPHVGEGHGSVTATLRF